MRKQTSYLDSINDGRQRRSRSSLDDLDRTLRGLEEKISARSGSSTSYDPRASEDIADKFRNLTSESRPASHAVGDRHGADRLPPSASFKNLAQDIELARIQEKNVAAIEVIASDLRNLRNDLQTKMTAELRGEIDSLRADIAETNRLAKSGSPSKELSEDIARLSDNIRALAQRSDDGGVNMLRLEFDEVKRALGALAREESIQQMNDRWSDMDRRWDAANTATGAELAAEPEFQALAARLDDISEAVTRLPNSLSLHSLEDKLKILVSAVEQLSRNDDPIAPQSIGMIEQRLDEISRAIVASSVSVQAAVPNTESFERIEARISSLASQIEELTESQSESALLDRINSLTQQVENLTDGVGAAPGAVDNLAAQIAALSEKLEANEAGPSSDLAMQDLERRYERVVAMLEHQHEANEQKGQALLRDLEARLDSIESSGSGDGPNGPEHDAILRTIDARFNQLAQHFDDRITREPDDSLVHNLETRLTEISARLDSTVPTNSGVDADLIRSLENQIAGLTQQLERPDLVMPEHEDIGPRLKQLEHSLADSRGHIMEAAREAAESAIRALPAGAASGPSVVALADDLKSLENLTRNSDERNARTFEAIHDTLLKIVDRLGSLEAGSGIPAPESKPDASMASTRGMLNEGNTPPIDPSSTEADFAMGIGGDRPASPDSRRDQVAPPEEVDEATVAAATGDSTRASQQGTEGGRKSMLSGLAKALKGKSQQGDDEKVLDPAFNEPQAYGDLDDPVSDSGLNDKDMPLEPGSGAPDLGSIMARVNEERRSAPGADDPDAAKSDFIAAARRAAQAAAAEAETSRSRMETRGSSSGFKALEILQQKRKPILVGASVLLIALAGMQLTSAFLSDDTGPMVAELPVPVEEQSQEAEPIEQASAFDGDQMADATEPVRVVEPEMIDPVEQTSDEEAAVATPEPELAAEVAADQAPEEPVVTTPVPTVKVEEVPVEAGTVALREAAQAGNAKALHEVGTRYAEGRGVTSDLKQAAKWFQVAADLGFAPAQYRIGNFYEKGLGVDRDPAKAMTWYQMAAEQGNASAMHNLAVLFAMGAGGQPDNESAARWFGKAAELGVKDSQFNLGILSAKGVGMQQDLEESYKWFALAAKTGDKDAASKRDEIANALRPEQLTTARAAVELWKAKPLNEAANVVDIPAAWKEDKSTTAAVGVDMKKAVKNIQLILNNNGYDAGPADGVMGARTKDAIIAFQKDNDMAATGEVDEALVKALLARNQ